MSVLVADAPALAAETHARCPGCDAGIAGDQRFCLACGLRLAPDELRLAALPLLTASLAPATAPAAGTPGFPRPVVRSAAITAVVVLVLGIGIGATIGPAAVGETAAAQRAVIVVSAPAPAAPAPAPATGDDAASAGDGSDGGAPDETQALADAGAGSEPSVPAAEAPADTPASSPPADDGGGGDDPAPPAAPPPGSLALAGTVAAVAADGEGFVLAARDGRLLHVHASGCGVAPGDDLHLRARQLANGTWSADRVRRVGVAELVRAAGTVVWTDPASGRYALGARGVTLLVSAPPAPAAPADPQAPPAPAPPVVPALGTELRVRLQPAAAHDGQPAGLVEQTRRDAPPADPATPAPPLELAGAVQSVDPQARTLALALDGAAQPSLTIALTIPPAIDLATLLPAQRVAVTALPGADGALTLSGVSPDGDALAADDATASQGDQAPATPPSGDRPPATVSACALLGSGAGPTRSTARSSAAG